MSKEIEYKGYRALIHFNKNTGIYSGIARGINDLINFQTKDVNACEDEFKKAVDEYLDFCKALPKEPEREGELRCVR